MISLGGMTIATGMVVDASIVVTENIHRIRLEQPRLRAWQAIACATRQVWLPVLASTLTSIVVFFPLSFTAPLASAVLGDLAQTIVFALFSSLLIALLVVPLLAFYMLRSTDKNKGPAGQGSRHRFQGSAERLSERFSALLVACYRRLLSGFLGRRALQWGFIALSITLFALSLSVLGPRIRQSIIGTPSSNRVVLWFNIDPGYEDREEFVALLDDLSEEARLIGGSEIESIFGQTEGYRYSVSSKPSSTEPQPILNLLPRAILSRKFADLDLKKELKYALGATVSELKVDKKGSSETQTIRIRNPQGKGREYQDIYNHPVPVSVDKKTQYIPLHHFVRFEEDRQESYISSSNGKRQFYITIDLRTGESEATPSQIAEAQADINALLAANPDIMAPGVSYSWYNTQKEMQESIRSLTLALVIGLLLVFLVITAQFGSYRYPLIILVTVPLGITGSLFFLWLSHSTISLNSLLGMILLGGVAVNNAIIMIDFFLIILKERTGELLPGTAAERHRIKRAAIVDACSLRLTPILITMFTTLLGMLPIALALGDGMNVLQPLGIAVAGGLGVSTLFTLFMIPCLLNMVPGKRERSLSLRDLGREGI